MFIDDLKATLSKLLNDIELALLGDFSVDYSDKQKSNLCLKSKLESLANQLIQSPTRVTVNDASLIDLIFVNNSHRMHC